MNPKDILTSPPPLHTEPDFMDQDAKPKVLNIENSAVVLEHRLVETLMDVMSNGTDSNRKWAADQTADLLGKKSKSQVLITDNLNIQNNNNFLDHFNKQAQIGEPNDPANDQSPPVGEDGMDTYDADFTDLGDEESEI